MNAIFAQMTGGFRAPNNAVMTNIVDVFSLAPPKPSNKAIRKSDSFSSRSRNIDIYSLISMNFVVTKKSARLLGIEPELNLLEANNR